MVAGEYPVAVLRYPIPMVAVVVVAAQLKPVG